MTTVKEEIVQNLRTEFDEFLTSKHAFQFVIPYESALEYQHGLNHLCLAALKSEDNPERLNNIRKAAGHIHRAHLDYLKIWLHQKYKELEATNDPAIWQVSLRPCLLKMEELYSLGQSDRTGIFKKYRDLLSSFSPPPASRQVLPVRNRHVPISMEIFKTVKELYWEWAQFEAMLASLSDERHYVGIMDVINGLECGHLEKALLRQSATMCCGIVDKVIKMPKNKTDALWVSEEISTSHEWKTCQAAKNEVLEYGHYLEDCNAGKNTESQREKLGPPDKERISNVISVLMDDIYKTSKPLVHRIINRFFDSVDLKYFGLPR